MCRILEDDLVSILMPVYNSETYLEEAIRGILDQTYTNWELIVVDDGSTDKTVEIIEKFVDDRIKLFENDERIGLVKSRNLGISNAKGKYLCIHDSDDVSDETRLSRQVEEFTKDPGLNILGTSAVVIDEESNILEYRDFHDVNSLGEARDAHIICHSSAMIKMDVLTREGSYDTLFKSSEDYELFLRLLKKGYKIRNMKEHLLLQRKHGSMVSVKERTKQILYSCLADEIHRHNKVDRSSIQDDIEPDEIFQLLSNEGKYRYHLKNAGSYKYKRETVNMILEALPITYYYLKTRLGF